jgi:ammonia channel protein AmtB
MRFAATKTAVTKSPQPAAAPGGSIIVKHALPALVGLTALITSALVHAGYAIWWFSQSLFRAHATSYDWAGALAVSGTATTIVLIAALVVRRLAAGNTSPAETGAAPATVPARVTRR